MAAFDRLLKGISNGNDESTKSILKMLESREEDGLFSSDSVIPNQEFTPATRKGKPITLFLSPEAVEAYRQILRLQTKQRRAAMASGNFECRPIEYICLGYQEDSGDIFIDEIQIPAINYHMELKKTSSKESAIDSMFQTRARTKHAKHEKIETMSSGFDYLTSPLTEKQLDEGHATAKVCLFGTTANALKKNSFTLGDISKAVAPGDCSFPHDIITGVISHFTTKSTAGLSLTDIECLIIPHTRSPKTGKTTPSNLKNIVETIAITDRENATLHKLLTSTAEQPNKTHRIFENM